MRILLRVGVAVVVLAAAGLGAYYIGFTGGLNRVEAAIEIGGDMPEFELECAAGETHSLEKYEDKIVVIEFASQHCPWSRAADKSFIEWSKQYKDQDVVFIGIDSHSGTSLEDIAEYQEEIGKNYPVVKDEGNEYADVIGANVTPEVVIVDKEGKIRYHGAVDNRKSPEGSADENYVADALAAVVAGEEVATTTTKAWGCSIKRAS